ncbi:MAG TPA: circadian clock KaiB family protein [Opitutaceae bacterium]|nr:circadian clock KaiB family protein [Opitutaceae bacterium]
MSAPRTSKANAGRATDRVVLRLYVAGQLPGSAEAEAMLRTLCAEQATKPPKLEVVDLLQQPDRALQDGIMVTPTLVRLTPKPEVRILGFLSDLARVRSALGLRVDAKAAGE